MPNFDGGHYFYTGLFPVRWASEARRKGDTKVPSHLLRQALATLPNFSEAAGQRRVSPFARCKATHFIRFAVIDDPAYNGRDGGDAIMNAGSDLAVHQPVDHLSRAWLMVTADFDVPDGSDGARDAWAAGMWELARPELTAIFEHCRRFKHVDGDDKDARPVESGEDFARYLAHGQIETTMSFNDYWLEPPPLPATAVKALVTVALLPALLAGLVTAYLRWWPWQWPWRWQWPFDWGGILLTLGASLAGLALGVWLAYRLVMRRGARPFPTAPNSDLESVLKGLYLQQRLTRFAIDNQGASPEDLHRAFGAFLAEVRPEDLEGPTQARGVLKS
jgi:hypothetical protein